MIIVHKAYWKSQEPEKLSQVDNVDRSTYIPLSVQFERMRLAGLQLENLKAYQYNVELQDFIKSGKSISEYTDETLLKRSFIDKTEADTLFKMKLEKLQKARRTQDIINDYKAKSKQLEREREIQEQAILNYKKSLENSNQSPT